VVGSPADFMSHRIRQLTGVDKVLAGLVALGMTLFQLYTALFGLLNAPVQRSVHLLFGLALVFLLYPAVRPRSSGLARVLHVFDYLLVLLTLASVGYVALNADWVLRRMPYVSPLTPVQIALGAVGVILFLEATRRTVGGALPVLAALFIVYCFIGPYLPGILTHRGFSFEMVVDHLFYSSRGIFGSLAGISATYLFMFILFGALMQRTGAGDFFINLALSLTGRFRGGPAKTAVLASGFMGMINGTAIANVLTTGSITIPLMKRIGYRPHYAGAVEAAASTGGQFTPPIMGAAAFVIAEMLGVPYIQVCKTAVIPALLFYLSVLLMIDFQAARLGLRGLKRDELPGLKTSFLSGVEFLVPVMLIVWFLLQGYSPLRAATVGVLSLLLVRLIRPRGRLKLWGLLDALADGARMAVPVVVAIGTAGIITSLVMLTGLGTGLTNLVLAVAGDSLLTALFLVMCTSIILGMGLPTVAAYIIQVPLVVPVLIQLGVQPLFAHFFVFFFACMSAVTPPVAAAAYAGAMVAQSDLMVTAVTAWKLSLAAFIIPYMFIFGPSLLMVGTVLEIALTLLSAVLGIFALACAIEGWVMGKAGPVSRLLCLAGALVLIRPGLVTDLVGMGLVGLAFFLQAVAPHRSRAAAGL